MLGTLRVLLIVLALGLPGSAAQAVQPDEVLPDATLESRARALSLGLRCLVCQNQSIDDSDAPLARDLRVLVRERLVEGDSDAEIIDYVVARYGDFVLLKPPLKPSTIALWLSPILLLLAGMWLARLAFARTVPQASPSSGLEAELSAEERAKLDAVLRSTDDDSQKPQ
jgi:cytochrome c-type biogenesis protein CcmH